MTWNEGDVVRKLRATFGLTLDQLATAAGVSLTAINRLETGRTKEMKRATLSQIAAVFGLSLSEVLSAVPPQTISVSDDRALLRRLEHEAGRTIAKIPKPKRPHQSRKR